MCRRRRWKNSPRQRTPHGWVLLAATSSSSILEHDRGDGLFEEKVPRSRAATPLLLRRFGIVEAWCIFSTLCCLVADAQQESSLS